ncbi:nickel pincer cofactor biosynthesis protein LarC [Frankia nepalensis]|nr:LarC family nickel insertion protein [Frankia nepalensis]
MTDPGPRRVGWLDLSCGASGDMLLGALVGAGVPLDVLTAAVDALGLPIRLEARQVRRAGLAATKVDVRTPAGDATTWVLPDDGPAPASSAGARTWADIRALLAAAPLAAPVRERATATFAALAAAEARVHGIDPAAVHFHEVGALDAIADVVGVSAGLDHLALDELVATPIALGGGRAATAHGVLPIPGPAVLELLAAAGAPAAGGPVAVELCTPTGAALVVTAATDYGQLPPLRVTAVGSGAGTRDLPGRPNIVRLVVGDALGDRPAGPSARRAVGPPTSAAEPATAHALGVDDHPGGHAHGGQAHGRHQNDAHSHGDHPHGHHPHGGHFRGDRFDGDRFGGGHLDCDHSGGDHSGSGHSDGGHSGGDHARRDPGPAAEAAGRPGDGDGAAGVVTSEELLLEANVDDLDPRVWPSVLTALLDAGAVDAWLTPILMKKGRPAHTLRALVPPWHAAAARAAVFRHTSTLGLREIPVRKHARARGMRAVEVAGHPVRVKISFGGAGGDATLDGVAQPEWEDVARAAGELGWPTRRVLAAASALAHAGRWSDAPAPGPGVGSGAGSGIDEGSGGGSGAR